MTGAPRIREWINQKARQIDPKAFSEPLTRALLARRHAARDAAWNMAPLEPVYEWKDPRQALPPIYILDAYPPPVTLIEKERQIAARRVAGLDCDQIANEFAVEPSHVRLICHRLLRPVYLKPQVEPEPPLSLPWRLRKALKAAAEREHGNICPIERTTADGEEAIIRALEELGLCELVAGKPTITDKGRRAIQ